MLTQMSLSPSLLHDAARYAQGTGGAHVDAAPRLAPPCPSLRRITARVRHSHLTAFSPTAPTAPTVRCTSLTAYILELSILAFIIDYITIGTFKSIIQINQPIL